MSILFLPIELGTALSALLGALIALTFSLGLHSLWHPVVSDEFKDLSSHAGRMLGALYSLILALAFNTAMSERAELEEAIDDATEAVAVQTNELADLTEELLAAQGSPADVGGYYLPDDAMAKKEMRPSPTFNAIIDGMG